MVELPAVLRLQAHAKGLLQLEGRRGDAISREAHEEARGDDGAFAARHDLRLRDVAAMEAKVTVEVGRNAELAIGCDRRCESP